MKIRTVEQLFDFTTNELAWRKKELFSLEMMSFSPNLSLSKKNVLLRSTITLTYAHWEGFIKNCASAYIQFVALQRLNNNELSPNFLALSIKPLLMNGFQSKKADDHIKIVKFFLNDLPISSSIPFKDVIDTQSNLSSMVLRNIINTIGLDYSIYETKEKLLDEKLLKTRNQIAHGEYVILSDQEVRDIGDEFITLMNDFKNQIDNAAILKAYKI